MSFPKILNGLPCNASLIHVGHSARPLSCLRRTHWESKSSPHPRVATICPKAGDALGLSGTQAENNSLVTPDKEGYITFEMTGCEFLVAQTLDGALDLSQTFVVDLTTGKAERASTSGEIASTPAFYQPTEWASEYPGNIFEGKEAKRWVHRIYLIRIASHEPYRVDMETVYLLDAASGSLSRLEVRRLAPTDTPENEIRARIRDRTVVIDTLNSVPTPEGVVQAAMMGRTAMSVLEAEAAEVSGKADFQGKEAAEKGEGGEAVDRNGGVATSSIEGLPQDDGILYDDDMLKDFIVEVDDDNDTEFDEYDMPATDY